MTDLDILNELLEASPAVRRAMKAYLHKAFQRGQRHGERTAREKFDELLYRIHTVSHLNGATEIFKAQWEESAGRGTVRKAFNPNEPRDESGKWTDGGIDERRRDIIEMTDPISADDARKLVAGKTEKGDKGVDPAINFSGNSSMVYRIGEIPIDWFAPNEEGELYDSTTKADRVKDYVERGAKDIPPITVVFRKRSGTLGIIDGGHRISAARKRGDKTVPAIIGFKPSEIHKAFKEEDHPRDHGRFAFAPGSSGGSPAPASVNRIEHPADKHIRSLAERIRDVPKRIRVKVAHLVRKRYESLVEKFGKNGARAIIAASVMMLPVPLPGASMIPIALAHAVAKIRNLVSGERIELAKAVGPEPSREELEAAAREFIAGIYRDMGEEPPEIPEELDLDDAGEPDPEPEEIDTDDADTPIITTGEESDDSDAKEVHKAVQEEPAPEPVAEVTPQAEGEAGECEAESNKSRDS